jgi:cytochrome P450
MAPCKHLPHSTPLPVDTNKTLPSFAGSDSTASTMQSFCHHVLRDPAIHARLENELDNAAASGHLSAFPLWNETQALPYFQACLKEAMRLRPAVGLNITRLVPPQSAEIAGRRLPGGYQGRCECVGAASGRGDFRGAAEEL